MITNAATSIGYPVIYGKNPVVISSPKHENYRPYESEKKSKNPFSVLANDYREALNRARIEQSRKMQENQYMIDMAMCTYSVDMPYVDFTKKEDLELFKDVSDKFHTLEYTAKHQNPIHANHEAPKYLDITKDLRIYYEKSYRVIPFSDKLQKINEPTSIVRKSPDKSEFEIYDFKNGYATKNMKVNSDGSYEAEEFNLIYPENLEVDEFNFAKQRNLRFSAQNLKVSADKHTVKADSITLFSMDEKGEIIATRTYINPTIKYSEDFMDYEIQSTTSLFAKDNFGELLNSAYTNNGTEVYENGRMTSKYADAMVAFKHKNQKLGECLVYCDATSDAQGKLRYKGMYRGPVLTE
ncbi:hypothetical protein IJ670_01265 [bacterium]|nr:hypothetical protein [bacterium]